MRLCKSISIKKLNNTERLAEQFDRETKNILAMLRRNKASFNPLFFYVRFSGVVVTVTISNNECHIITVDNRLATFRQSDKYWTTLAAMLVL